MLKDKNFVLSFVTLIFLAALVLVGFKDETTRFTFIIPLFAGFILYKILTLSEKE